MQNQSQEIKLEIEGKNVTQNMVTIKDDRRRKKPSQVKMEAPKMWTNQFLNKLSLLASVQFVIAVLPD